MVYYFAYGSNMDKNDLDKWCSKKDLPTIRFLNPPSPAKLKGYKLSFNYCSSSWNAGAANIMESQTDCVYGLLMQIEFSDLEKIRKKEGYCRDHSKCSYDEISVDVETFDGRLCRNVKTYKVVKSKEKPDHQRPTRCYMNLIIKNVKKFPSEYMRFLESIETK